MFSFGSKPVDNLLGAAYLTGALELMKKTRSLNSSELDSYFDETKRVRRVLLSRAESDGYNKPVYHIEEAKKVAKNVLNSGRSTNKKNSNTKNAVTTPVSTTNSDSTPTSLTVSPTTVKTPNVSPITTVSTPTSVSTPTTVSTPTSVSPSTLVSDEIMPLKNTSTVSEMKKPNTPPPVLQLGGKRRRKTKKVTRRRK